MNSNATPLFLNGLRCPFNGSADIHQFEKRLSALRGTPDENLLLRCPQLKMFLLRAVRHLQTISPLGDGDTESVAHYLMGKGTRLPVQIAHPDPDFPSDVKAVLRDLLRTHQHDTLGRVEDDAKTLAKLQALAKHVRCDVEDRLPNLIEERENVQPLPRIEVSSPHTTQRELQLQKILPPKESSRQVIKGSELWDQDELHRSVLAGAKNLHGIEAPEQRGNVFRELLIEANALHSPQQRAQAIQALSAALPCLPREASQFSFDALRRSCATLELPEQISALRQLIHSPVNLSSEFREEQIGRIRTDIETMNAPEATVDLFKDLFLFCESIDLAEVRATGSNQLLSDVANAPETVRIALWPHAMRHLRGNEGHDEGVWQVLPQLARALTDISTAKVRTRCGQEMLLALLGRSTRLRGTPDQIHWLLAMAQLMDSNNDLPNAWREACRQHLSEQFEDVRTALEGHFDPL